MGQLSTGPFCSSFLSASELPCTTQPTSMTQNLSRELLSQLFVQLVWNGIKTGLQSIPPHTHHGNHANDFADFPQQPRQNNDIDCGMYVLVNALHIMVGQQAPSACCVSIWRAMFSMLLHRTSECILGKGISTPVPVADVGDCITLLSLFQSEAGF
ncbi:hypothetical protein D6D08_09433 [Aureobasidium pullulans]|nr:hypothetical protein D6D08_09433 [Aureobasidium pullulans]